MSALQQLQKITSIIVVIIIFFQMTLRSDKATKGFEHRESFMFHRIDIQRLTGKKCTF